MAVPVATTSRDLRPHTSLTGIAMGFRMPSQAESGNPKTFLACMSTQDHPPPLYQGRCLCGAIHYEARAEIKAASHCHCSMCQKAHGAAFGSYGNVPVNPLCLHTRRRAGEAPRVIAGRHAQLLPGMRLAADRHSAHGDAAAWRSLSLGTLDTPFTPKKPLRSIHADSVPAWHVAGEARKD